MMSTSYIHFIIIACLIQLLTSQLYVLQPYSITTDDHDALCRFQYDQNIASIHSNIQNAEADLTRASNNVLIGLTDEVIEDEWIFIDGTPWDYGTTFKVPPWNIDEPNDLSGEDCVEIGNSGLWNDNDCTTKLFALCNYPQQHFVINDPLNYQRILTPGNVIGSIDILDEIHIQFDITIHSLPSGGNESLPSGSILHFGDDDLQRYPGIYINGVDNFFHFVFSQPGTWNLSAKTAFNFITLEHAYHISMYQSQSLLSIYIDSAQIASYWTPSHSITLNQPMLVCMFGYQCANSTLTNLIVSSRNSPEPNKFNYLCDATNRISVVRGKWIFDDDGCVLTQSNISYSGAVAWFGDLDQTSLNWTDYTVEMKFKITAGRQAGLLIRCQSVSAVIDGGQQYFIGVDTAVNEIVLGRMNNGWNFLHYSNPDPVIAINILYTLRVEIIADVMSVYLDNEFAFSFTDSTLKWGSVALRAHLSNSTFYSLKISFVSDNYLYTVDPTYDPTYNPTSNPTFDPTSHPTLYPTTYPTSNPTLYSTNNPTTPTYMPSNRPTTESAGNVDSGISTTFSMPITDDNQSSNIWNKQNVSILVILIGILALICCIGTIFLIGFYRLSLSEKPKANIDAIPSVQFANTTNSVQNGNNWNRSNRHLQQDMNVQLFTDSACVLNNNIILQTQPDATTGTGPGSVDGAGDISDDTEEDSDDMGMYDVYQSPGMPNQTRGEN